MLLCCYVTVVVRGKDQRMHRRTVAVANSGVSKKGVRGEREYVYSHLL
jgi:hypothetical protein